MKLQKTLICTLLAATTIISGCGDDNSAPKDQSQVLAKVNGKEITIMQLNQLLVSQPKVDEKIKKQLLDKLIDQELLIQKSEELKLDRNPEVLQNIEYSKRQVLAQAAASKLIGENAEPSSTDIKNYYTSNAAMFENRNLFDVDVFVINKTDANKITNTELQNSTSAIVTAQVLDKLGVTYKQNHAKRYSEQLPDAIVKQLNQIKDGDMIKTSGENGEVVLMQLKSRLPLPVTETDAEQTIRQILINKNLQEKMQEKMNVIRSNSKIEIVSDLK